jgi:hypothetical protein
MPCPRSVETFINMVRPKDGDSLSFYPFKEFNGGFGWN